MFAAMSGGDLSIFSGEATAASNSAGENVQHLSGDALQTEESRTKRSKTNQKPLSNMAGKVDDLEALKKELEDEIASLEAKLKELRLQNKPADAEDSGSIGEEEDDEMARLMAELAKLKDEEKRKKKTVEERFPEYEHKVKEKKKKKTRAVNLVAAKRKKPKDIFHEEVTVIRHSEGCPDPSMHERLAMMWEWETKYEFPSPPRNDESWIAYGAEICLILDQAHEDYKKRIDLNVDGIYLRFWLQARYQEDLRTGRKSAIRRCKPGIGMYTMPAMSDNQCDNAEDKKLMNKLISGGTYTRADFMRLMEGGAILTLEKEWNINPNQDPVLGEHLVAEHYEIETQGSRELERIRAQMCQLQATSDANSALTEKIKSRRALFKKKFEELNSFLLDGARTREVEED